MDKLLIICGPTATGKTAFALQLAAQFNGELISADSRQVYIGMDIVTGKDIPPHFTKATSALTWKGRPITYYSDGSIRLWLTDMVFPHEPFNVSFFRHAATTVIGDIHARGKLPIIVGVTGLYIKSLTHRLATIDVPINPDLRTKLAQKTSSQLFDYLNRLNSGQAATLNRSDSHNPRRLLRAIEIALSPPLPSSSDPYDHLSLCLSSTAQYIYPRIDRRVLDRITAGAESELKSLLAHPYSWDLPALQTAGYLAWRPYLSGLGSLSDVIRTWQSAEHRDFHHQLTWFKKQAHLSWYDVSQPDWSSTALARVANWYNSLTSHAQEN